MAISLSSVALAMVLLFSEVSFQTATDRESLPMEKSPMITEKTNSSLLVGKVSDSHTANETKSRTKRNFIVGKHGMWNHKAVHYLLHSNLRPDERKGFLNAVKDIENKTCVRFRNGRGKYYIDVFPKRRLVCWAPTGKSQHWRQTLYVGPQCNPKIDFFHVILKILGMTPEHRRPDRDKFIFMDLSHIKPALHRFHTIQRGLIADEPYDYRSVMHFPNNYMKTQLYRPKLMKKLPGGPIIGRWENGLSELDARKVNKFFNCPVPHVHKPSPIRKKDKQELLSGHCNFDHGLCAWKNWINGPGDDEDQFDWLSGSEAKKYSGPAHDHSNGKPHGKFLYFSKPLSDKEKMSSGVLVGPFVKGPVCLTFYYYLNDGGHIRVFLKQADSTRDNPYEFITERRGRHRPRNQWWSVQQKIPARPKPFQIFIEGLKTPDLTDSVGIDDVFVFSGKTCNVCPGSHTTYDGKCCEFPFQYKQKSYDRCIKTPGKEFNGRYWCAITNNYDKDQSGGTCTDSNECYDNPCAAGATCVDMYFDYKCLCPEFKAGKNCDSEINECLHNPCRHGKCQDHARGYTCHCSSGFTGENCENDIDECNTGEANCGKTGKCENIPGSYICVCNPGFTGPKCSHDIDECSSAPCKNKGMCANLLNRFECTCPKGYSGKTCEIERCFSNPCRHGNCTNHYSGYTCECSLGYTGNNCETEIDECASNPCKNNAKCISLVNRFRCSCLDGYIGTTCEHDVNECLENPCRHGSCTNYDGGYSCECTEGYTGKNCKTDIDECLIGKDDCGVTGTCENVPGSYKCVCDAGVTGPKCLEDIDECLDKPCRHGRCQNHARGYTCQCEIGYIGSNCQHREYFARRGGGNYLYAIPKQHCVFIFALFIRYFI